MTYSELKRLPFGQQCVFFEKIQTETDSLTGDLIKNLQEMNPIEVGFFKSLLLEKIDCERVLNSSNFVQMPIPEQDRISAKNIRLSDKIEKFLKAHFQMTTFVYGLGIAVGITYKQPEQVVPVIKINSLIKGI